MPAAVNVAKIVRADLAAARAAWIAEAETHAERGERERSDFLATPDAAGRTVGFHALRHSFASMLCRAGVNPKAAQELLGHSTITLTMDHYMHTVLEDRATAVAKLPDLDAEPEGTADARRAG